MSDVIDLTVFGELQDSAGAEFVVELVDTFVTEAPGMFATLRGAYETGDADAFRRAAHSLKSNSLTFGAAPLAAAARALELGGLGAGSPSALDALEHDYTAAAARLKELCHA